MGGSVGLSMSTPSYFVDHKKGEVNELWALLQNPDVQKDPQRKRDVLKRVIAYQTLGIDVSRLFPEMMLATHTNDILQKKMIYNFIVYYAENRADLAMMTVNTLQKECCDQIDPMVRGLALKHLSSLRVPNLAEYVVHPVTKCLEDVSPYVRRSAVLSVLKLFHLDPKAAEPMLPHLDRMLRDRDPQVVANCIMALDEVYASTGGIQVNKGLIYNLLNRMKEFNEWSQCTILDLVARYETESEKEVYDIMSLLDERLKSTNAAVVLSTTKVFLNFTMNMPKVHQHAFLRVKDPLLTLMTGGGHEMAFTVLAHIKVIAERSESQVFDDEYKKFYCRYNDPVYVKKAKLEVLKLIASDGTVAEIVGELKEYVTDVDIEVARISIRTIGRIAWRLENSAARVIQELLGLLEVDIDYVTAEVVVSMADLMRKYPAFSEQIVEVIPACLATIEEPEARVAVLWMLGEVGDQLEEGPYLLEPMVEQWDELKHSVRMELMVCTMKMFFKRPPECQKMLGKLLAKATADPSNVDVHDKALLYYRLLDTDVEEAQRIICGPEDKSRVTQFTEDTETEVADQIFEEFNSLSVIYGQPAVKFVTYKEILPPGSDGAALDSDGDDDDEEDEESEDESEEEAAPLPSAAPPRQAPKDSSDDGSDDDDSDDGDSDSGSGSDDEEMEFKTTQTFGKQVAQVFEKNWMAASAQESASLRLQMSKSSDKDIEKKLKKAGLHMMATGMNAGSVRAYYIGEREDKAGVFMAELVMNLSSRQVTATLKSDDTSSLGAFKNFFTQALVGL